MLDSRQPGLLVLGLASLGLASEPALWLVPAPEPSSQTGSALTGTNHRLKLPPLILWTPTGTLPAEMCFLRAEATDTSSLREPMRESRGTEIKAKINLYDENPHCEILIVNKPLKTNLSSNSHCHIRSGEL